MNLNFKNLLRTIEMVDRSADKATKPKRDVRSEFWAAAGITIFRSTHAAITSSADAEAGSSIYSAIQNVTVDATENATDEILRSVFDDR